MQIFYKKMWLQKTITWVTILIKPLYFGKQTWFTHYLASKWKIPQIFDYFLQITVCELQVCECGAGVSKISQTPAGAERVYILRVRCWSGQKIATRAGLNSVQQITKYDKHQDYVSLSVEAGFGQNAWRYSAMIPGLLYLPQKLFSQLV